MVKVPVFLGTKTKLNWVVAVTAPPEKVMFCDRPEA
jgi:hypothetical protein